MNQNKVRVIKISKEALFEFIYEKFNECQADFLEVDPIEVSNHFDINFEDGKFIYCAIKSEDKSGNFLTMPKEINLQKLMKVLPDTTDSLFTPSQKYYREFTKEELAELSDTGS